MDWLEVARNVFQCLEFFKSCKQKPSARCNEKVSKSKLLAVLVSLLSRPSSELVEM